MSRQMRAAAAAVVLVLAVGACATLANIVQAPRFSSADEMGPQLRLLGPSADRPLGGAAIRLWARVENPNAFGVNLAALTGDLFLEGTRAAGLEFPLGLPLSALQDTVIPLDLTIGFADLPRLADVAQRALTRGTVDYRLDGVVSLDAGPLGTPSFGPQTWLRGQLDVSP